LWCRFHGVADANASPLVGESNLEEVDVNVRSRSEM